MGKGSNTTSTSSTSSADPQAAQLYRDILSRAQGVASTPYQAYTGDLTAPVNSQQQAGIAGINANANYASPYISQAAGLAQTSSAPITSAQISQYLNPYTQNVVDATTQQLQHDNGVAMANLQGNQIAQGALGGNATGVAKGVLAGQQNRTDASTIAGLYQQGYTQALGAAQQQQQAGLAGANALANYGLQGQNAALSGANAQIGAGTLQQTTQQANLNALYNQYQLAQAYPYQQTQWLAGVGTGVGSNLGGTSSGTTTGPAPNQTAQYLGAGLSAASLLLSDERAKEDIEHIGHTKDGQKLYRYRYKGSPQYHIGLIAQEVEQEHPEHVHQGLGGLRMVDIKGATDDAVERASGGGVGGTPYADVQGWIPTMQIHGGSGAPHAGAPSLPSNQQPATDFTKMANGITSVGKGLQGLDWSGLNAAGLGNASGEAWGGGSFLSGDVYGGSSANPAAGMTADDYGEGFADGGAVTDGEVDLGERISRALNGGRNYAQRVHYNDTRAGLWNSDPAPERGASYGGVGRSMSTRRALDMGEAQRISDKFRGYANGGVAGYATGGSPDLQDWLSDGGFNALDAEALHRDAGASRGPVPGAGLNFEDRAAPTVGALARGDFDTQGANNTTFEGTPGMQASNAGLVPTPRSRPEAAGPPVVAGDDDDEETPAAGVAGAGRAPQAPVMAFQPEGGQSYRGMPDAITQPRGSGIGFGLISPNAQSGLLAAGLGMMASRSPFLGNAVGEGGIAGVSAYGAAEERDRKAAEEAQKLSREAQKLNFDQNLSLRKQGETERHNKVTEDTSDKAPSMYVKNPDGSISLRAGAEDAVARMAAAKQKMAPGSNIDSDTADFLADRLRVGDNKALTGLGHGLQGSNNILEVQRRAAARSAAGIPIMDSARDMQSNTAANAGLVAAERTQAQIMSKLSVYGRSAYNAADLALEASKEFPRTSFPKVNAAIAAYRSNTGDPGIKAFGQAVTTLANEYARAVGGGHGTVHQQEQAERRLNETQSPEQFKATVEMMKREIIQAEHALPAARQQIREIYAPKAGGSSSSIEGKTDPASTAQGFNVPEASKREKGKVYDTPRGKLQWTGEGWVQP